MPFSTFHIEIPIGVASKTAALGGYACSRLLQELQILRNMGDWASSRLLPEFQTPKTPQH